MEGEVYVRLKEAGVTLPSHPLVQDPARDFLYDLHRFLFVTPRPALVRSLYTETFHKLNDTIFAKSAWPEWEVLEKLFSIQNELFVLLYKEIYYRQIFARTTATLEQRAASYENYVNLFNHLLGTPPKDLQMPAQWLWDIVDEFIYQFQNWCHYRSADLKDRSVDELIQLRELMARGTWDILAVLNALYAIVNQNGGVVSLLEEAKEKGLPESSILVQKSSEAGSENVESLNLFRMLGYFGIIGLLRVHCLLGDFTQALNVVGPIQLASPTGLFTRVTACNVTTFYYVGFAYLMSKRYRDAIWAFQKVLTSVTRNKFAEQTKGYQFEAIIKQRERMMALMAVCVALCPNQMEDHALNLRDHADQISTIQSTWVGSLTSKDDQPDSGDEDGDDEGRERPTLIPKVLKNQSLEVIAAMFVPSCPKFVDIQSPKIDRILDVLNQKALLEAEIQASQTEVEEEDELALTPVEPSDLVKKQLEDLDMEYDALTTPYAPARYHFRVLLGDVQLQLVVPALRSALRRYTSITLARLSRILEVSQDQVYTLVMRYNSRSKGLKWTDKERMRPLEGEYVHLNDLRVRIEGDMVHINESTSHKRNTEFFLNSIMRLEEANKRLARKVADGGSEIGRPQKAITTR